jgi:hypothetical protein
MAVVYSLAMNLLFRLPRWMQTLLVVIVWVAVVVITMIFLRTWLGPSILILA